MIVSWNWLKDYVPLDMERTELERRLALAGLNHESTSAVADDWAIDLEITSNRPDCLGHIGVAREISVLWDRPLRLPDPRPQAQSASASGSIQVSIEGPELCPRYTARVIRGVRIGPSPSWLVNRLRTLGIAVINNVVDITNYVMMECGQPLHAFDLKKIRGHKIVVRAARPDETFVAIDHRTYVLRPGTCVIADAERAVALGGVMGGAETEITGATTDLLIEAADFTPLSVRGTARQLRLHSPSSYRFERGVDPAGIDWASRRACELILQCAGGELQSPAEDLVARAAPAREPIRLRLSQLPRVLGISVDPPLVKKILTGLGGTVRNEDSQGVTLDPPSWRRDLSREIDLIEEVARIHGYDQIPEDVSVPMVASQRSDRDRGLAKIRHVLTAIGFDEAMTPSLVEASLAESISPWTEQAPLRSELPLLRGADHLRRSLIPSLLEARQHNESLANPQIELFEIARAYWPQPSGLPHEPWLVSLSSGRDFLLVKTAVEQMLASLHIDEPLTVEPFVATWLERSQSVRLLLDGECFGVLGLVSGAAQRSFGLRQPATIVECQLDKLLERAHYIPRLRPISPYPAVAFDLNLVVDEQVWWSQIEQTVRQTAGTTIDELQYVETYRDPQQKDGPNKKRIVFHAQLRLADRTLTSDEANEIRQAIVAACQQRHGAILLG